MFIIMEENENRYDLAHVEKCINTETGIVQFAINLKNNFSSSSDTLVADVYIMLQRRKMLQIFFLKS